jgi:hypothetical protein
MFSVRITEEAKAAIVEQFALLGLSEPALHIRRSPSSGDVTRSSAGQVQWNIERPDALVLQFLELSSEDVDPQHILLVDGIRIILGIEGGRSAAADVEISVCNGKLLIDPLNREASATAATREVSTASATTNRGVPWGLVHCGEVLDASGNDRLRLYSIAMDDCGFWAHSMQWQRLLAGEWRTKLSLTQKQFQGEHLHRRWVSQLHSFEPDTGIAVVLVAEGNRPMMPPSSTTFLYSWRAWDLVKNVEVERLKNCDGPFEPLE